ncbi:MAG: inositol monophosphatase family protein [Pseudomonadota bacterium]
MRLEHTKVLQADMAKIGADLLAWRKDPAALHVHEPKALKTEADRRAHEALAAAIARAYPGDPIISEEDAAHSLERPDRYWLIDPIDGTASWLHGFDGFVTQAALIERETPVIGLVCAPALDLFYAGAEGEGAFLNGERLPPLAVRDGLIAIDNTPEPHGFTAALSAHMPLTGYVESGSLGLKCCRVADGAADIFAKNVVIRDWDLAPAAVLLSELGGRLTGLDGAPFPFSGSWEKPDGFVAARTGAALETCLAAIAALGD